MNSQTLNLPAKNPTRGRIVASSTPTQVDVG